MVDDRILEESLERPIIGAASLGSDSATGRETGAVKVAFGNSMLGTHFDYYRSDTDNVHIPGFAESAILRAMEEDGEEEGHEEAFGRIENTDSKTEGGAAAVSFTGENGFLGLSYSVHDSNYGIPGHEHEEGEGDATEEEETVRIVLEQSRVDLRGGYNFSGPIRSARLRLARNDYNHVELEGSEIGTVFDTKGTDARLELQHGGTDRLDGTFGGQYKIIDFSATGDEAFVPPSKTEQSSLFVFEELVLSDSWVLQGSARVEWQTIESPSRAKYDDSALGLSAGAIWSFSDSLSLAANLVHSERHPNSTELYADGPHLAVGRFERGSVTLGNGFLDKELSTNLDLTLRGAYESVEFLLTGFINEVDDYVLLAATGQTADTLPVFEYRQADARLVGLEAEARVELMESTAGHLHSRVFVDLVRAEERNSGNYLPRIPPLRYGIGLHYTLDRIGAMVEATFHSRQKKTAPRELPTNDYTMLKAELSYALENPNLFAFIQGTNLTDEDARQHASPLKDTVPLPGRSLRLGMRYDF
ncbi:MAG: TonB-dependent receptor [Gammaproteobacteria bacterium]|nr:TonB-dependent receptor [Gammaproteobacteria bacterium]